MPNRSRSKETGIPGGEEGYLNPLEEERPVHNEVEAREALVPFKVRIHCHGCMSEIHEFDSETGRLCKPDGRPYPLSLPFLYTCSIAGTAYSHPPLRELHQLTDGTYADPEQWYKFPKELWGSYEINTRGYSG